MSNEYLILYTDGGSRGNPGHAGIGAVLYERKNLTEVKTVSKYIGVKTNNQAEYTALLMGLQEAKKLGARQVDCYLDSELVVKQLNRQYKVKDQKLAQLFVKIWNLTHSFKKVTFSHVRREKNKVADALVNQALDKELKNK